MVSDFDGFYELQESDGIEMLTVRCVCYSEWTELDWMKCGIDKIRTSSFGVLRWIIIVL